VASFQQEAADVSPAVGLDGQGYLGQHHELHRAGELELRRPCWRPALQVGPAASMCNVYGVPTSRRRVSHSTTQQHWNSSERAAALVVAQEPPSTLSTSSSRIQLCSHRR
jgi:hypothetical protein